jgi:hypothetical protein
MRGTGPEGSGIHGVDSISSSPAQLAEPLCGAESRHPHDGRSAGIAPVGGEVERSSGSPPTAEVSSAGSSRGGRVVVL